MRQSEMQMAPDASTPQSDLLSWKACTGKVKFQTGPKACNLPLEVYTRNVHFQVKPESQQICHCRWPIYCARWEGKDHKLWLMHWLIEETSEAERAVTRFQSNAASSEQQQRAALGGRLGGSGLSTGGRRADEY